MICPNCSAEMRMSDFTIDTSPEINEFFCKCGLVLDNCEGVDSVCFRTKNLTEDQIETVKSLLNRKIV